MPSFRAIKGATPLVRRLRLVMSENCITNQRFGELCGMNRPKMSRLMNARSYVGVKEMVAVERALADLGIEHNGIQELVNDHNEFVERRRKESKAKQSTQLIDQLKKLNAKLSELSRKHEEFNQQLQEAKDFVRSLQEEKEHAKL